MSARKPSAARRRFFAPEVVQTSSMDCGPAALACLLEGFGIQASYGRLREACQTDVDGTSIDTLEETAVALGLEAEQLLVPFEHLLHPEAVTLPALVVVHHPSGARHFVVAWRRVGGLLQLMDPAGGRRWVGARRFLGQVYAHAMELPASTWRAWMAHPFHRTPLAARLVRLGFTRPEAAGLVEGALAEPGWKPVAALQAALGVVERLERARAVRRGAEARRLLAQLQAHALEEDPATSPHVPAAFWPAQRARTLAGGEDVLRVEGAVAVRVRGRRARAATTAAQPEPALSPELAAALQEPRTRPLRELLSVLRHDGLRTPATLAAGLVPASLAVLAQALFFRGLLELPLELGGDLRRLGALGILVLFLALLCALELSLAGGLMRLGRHLEGRMRVAFQVKLPRLGDRFFHSRPAADMTERVQAGTGLRAVPAVLAQIVRVVTSLALTVAGIAWIAPRAAGIALVAGVLSVLVPFLAQRSLGERELRARSHRAALGRFYLDALLGLVAVRTHGAERAVRREHEALLAEWVRAARRFLAASVGVESIGALLGTACATAIVAVHVAPAVGADGAVLGFPPGLLLLAFWALALPTYGHELALLAQQVPAQRNVARRILEPLGAPEEGAAGPANDASAPEPSPVTLETRTALRAAGAQTPAVAPALAPPCATEPETIEGGVPVELHGVAVVAAGREILRDVSLSLRAGEHVAIVGRSGAGKSSLLGLLLGWHRAAEGELRVAGRRLEGATLASLRRVTAWVDPGVQLWNRSLLANLTYGNASGTSAVGRVLPQARLEGVLAALPGGLATPLGQGGGLVSGGEGQRVRLGRALLREDVRLAVLDEPFVGLDRTTRRALLQEARAHWAAATLLCVTHDIEHALEFPRVLVIDDGRLVEDGAPRELAARADSPFARLLRAETEARREVWSADHWERWQVAGGAVAALDAREDEA